MGRLLLKLFVTFWLQALVLSTPSERSLYGQLCRSISSSPPISFINDVEKRFLDIKKRLQETGVLEFPLPKDTEEKCLNTANDSDSGCVYLRRFKLFENLKEDLNWIVVEGTQRQNMYRRLMMLHPEFYEFCKRSVVNGTFFKYFPDITRIHDREYQRKLNETVENVIKTPTSAIRSEAHRLCKHTGPDCLLKDVLQLVNVTHIFLSHVNRMGWDDPGIRNYLNALTFHCISLRWNYCSVSNIAYCSLSGLQPQNLSDQQKVLIQVLSAISHYLDNEEDANLWEMLRMLPEGVNDKLCRSRNVCVFWRIVDQARVHALSRQNVTEGGVMLKTLNTKLDFKTFLEQMQMGRILKQLTDQESNLVAVAQDLKDEMSKVTNNRFRELKSYFINIHTFSLDKATADAGVIEDIQKLLETTVTVAREIDGSITFILINMIASAGVNTYSKSSKLGFAIAQNINPLKLIFNGPDINAVVDATEQLANAIASLVKGAKLLSAFATLKDKARHVIKGFETNKIILEAMKVVMESVTQNRTSDDFETAKLAFLGRYTNFSSVIKKSEITELAAYFIKVVDEACQLIESTDSVPSAIIKSVVGGSGHCWLTKIKIDKMIAGYEDIYDKQMELVTALVDIVQANVGLKAAEGILAGYDTMARSSNEPGDILQRIQQLAAESYVSYRIMVVEVVSLYCDELQYRAGGVRPNVCKNTGTDLATLIAYVEQSCGHSTFAFKTIPGTVKSSGDMTSMDLNKVYSGEEIVFQIPDSRWLLDNNWITEAHLNSVIYVYGFEVYLPNNVKGQRDVSVWVSAEGYNQLVRGDMKYKITPSKPLIFEYKIGHGVICRQPQSYPDPYNICPAHKMSDICPVTKYPCSTISGNKNIYPSIFSRFKIRVVGYEGLPVPNPQTPLPVKIAVGLCAFIREEQTRRPSNRTNDQGMEMCCSADHYWSQSDRSCQKCPASSTAELNGYYCERQVGGAPGHWSIYMKYTWLYMLTAYRILSDI